MAYDGVYTDDEPVPIDRYYWHGHQRGRRRRVIAENYLYRQRERETLQRKFELAHAHAELNGSSVDEEDLQYEEQK